MTLRQYFEILMVQTGASIKAEAKRTSIGYLWWILDPLMFIAIYYVVFGMIIKNKTDNFIVFLIIGIIVFQWFQASITEGAATIANASGLIKRIRIPKVIFILTKVFHNFWQFCFVFLVYNVAILFFGISPSIHFLAVPIIMLVQMICILSITIPLASVFPFFPDIKHIIQPILRAMLFVSGIFFSSDKITDETLRTVFYLNPMANLIDAYRDTMLNHAWPDWVALGKITLIAVCFIYIGLKLIDRNDSGYAKVAR